MNDSALDKVRQTVADVFGVPLADVTADSSPQTLEAWDSMAHLNLILAVEQSFGVQFAPEEIATMVSVSMIVRTLNAKLGRPPAS